MGWKPETNDPVLLSRQLNAINVRQYEDRADETDVVSYELQSSGSKLSGSTVAVDDGALKNLVGDQLFTTVPGEYDLQVLGRDQFGNVLKVSLENLKIINTFRRYVIPETHVVIDCDKPWRAIDGWPTVQVLNTTEPIRFTMLHPEDSGSESNCGIGINVFAPPGFYTITDDGSDLPQWVEVAFDISDPDDPAWQVDSLTGDKYVEVVIGNLDVKYSGQLDKFRMSYMPAMFVVRIWNTYDQSRVSQDMACLSDASFQMLLRDLPVLGQHFRGRIRTIGNLGTVRSTQPSQAEGDWIDVTSVQQYINIILTTYDDYTEIFSGNAAISPVYEAGVTSTVSTEVAMLAPTEVIVNQVQNVRSYSGVEFRPASVYNWMTILLDSAGDYKLHVLPLAVDPVDMPTLNGWPGLIPIDIMIEDTNDPNSVNNDYQYPIFLKIKEPNTDFQFFFVDDLTYGVDRVIGPATGNPIKCNVPYRFWVRIPGNTGAASATIVFNQVEWVTHQDTGGNDCTFSIDTLNLSDKSDTNFHGNVSRWVSYGNYTYLMTTDDDDGINSMWRAAYLAHEFKTYHLDMGNAEYTTRYLMNGIGNASTEALSTAYFLANANWQNAIDEWFPKIKTFMIDNGNGTAWLAAPNGFEAATNYGLDIGLPFGTHTAYFTGSPSINVNRDVVSLVAVYYWFDLIPPPWDQDQDGEVDPGWDEDQYRRDNPGGGMGDNNPTGGPDDVSLAGVVTVAKCWKGDYHVVHGWVYDGTALSEDNGPLPSLQLSGVIDWSHFQLADFGWIDFGINMRGYNSANDYKADGGEWPYTVDHEKVIGWDPTSPDEKVILNADLTYNASYDENEELVGDFQQVIPGHVQILGVSTIWRGSLLQQIHGWSPWKMTYN